MITGEVKIIGDGLVSFLLLPCGATGSSGFDVDAISTLQDRRVHTVETIIKYLLPRNGCRETVCTHIHTPTRILNTNSVDLFMR
jgi:hypothetical protein